MMKRIKSLVLGFVVLSLVALVSCDEDFNAIDAGAIIGNQNFSVRDTTFPVFAYNKRLQAVRTNDLPAYQFGNYTDPIYGKTSAAMAAQVTLPITFATNATRIFGQKTQEQEDEDAASGELVGDEQERITRIYLDLPYFAETADRDNDGVVDSLDADPTDAASDSDGDGVNDSEERAAGTDPLNTDTDGDDIPDGDDDCIDRDAELTARSFALDSIYGNISEFTVKVARFNFYLRELDPEADFQESQEFFSNALETQFTGFIGDEYFSGARSISDQEILVTEDIDDNETSNCGDPDPNNPPSSVTVVNERLSPRIRIEMNQKMVDDFQAEIFDQEGADFFRNNDDFTEHFRGLFISMAETDELLMLLDMQQAQVVVEYEYQGIDDKGTDDTADDVATPLTESIAFPMQGNIVNTLTNSDFPEGLIAGDGVNADRLYLKGGAGTFAEIRLLDEDDSNPTVEGQLKANQWLINEASLIFHLDQPTIDAAGATFNNAYRIYLYDTTTELPVADYFFDPTTGVLSTDDKIIHGGIIDEDSSGATYKIRITQHVNNFLRNEEDFSNVTLGLVVTPDIDVNTNYNAMVGAAMDSSQEMSIPIANIINPFGTVLYGGSEDAPEDKRLRLEIIYSDPNQ